MESIHKKPEIKQVHKSKVVTQLENGIALGALQYIILAIVSEKNCATKEGIVNSIKDKSSIKLDSCTVNTSLDMLWFEEMICTDHSHGRCLYYLTKKGNRTLNTYKERKEEIIMFTQALLDNC